ncbi:unnamed protein product, partial [marine sediment metagenome]
VFIKIMKELDQAVIINLDLSPRPKIIKKSGKRAITGIARHTSMIASRALYILREYPIRRPTGIPTTAAREKPIISL